MQHHAFVSLLHLKCTSESVSSSLSFGRKRENFSSASVRVLARWPPYLAGTQGHLIACGCVALSSKRAGTIDQKSNTRAARIITESCALGKVLC